MVDSGIVHVIMKSVSEKYYAINEEDAKLKEVNGKDYLMMKS